MKNFEDNLEVKTVEQKLYIWTCPKCSRKIESRTKKRVKSLAKQHDKLKHN